MPALLPFNSPAQILAAPFSKPHSSSFPPKLFSKLSLTFFPLSASLSSSPHRSLEDDEEHAIGDCLVFDELAFEEGVDPFLSPAPKDKPARRMKPAASPEPESLVPDRWKGVVEEMSLTKKEKRKIAHQLKFGSRMEQRQRPPLPTAEEYQAYREMKLAQLNPVVLDDPKRFPPEKEVAPPEHEGRAAPRDPRAGLRGGSLEEITKFFNSRKYVPGEVNIEGKKPKGSRKLFTMEEKALLRKRIPDLAEATSSKWLPLHTLAASGEFYLLDKLLKHNVDINAADKDGLTAIHKAVLSKKQAITNYLLRESANPFVRDKDGATLIHYAVQTASSQAIKILLLYNVDINLPDNEGWTPLHLAVQTQRTDIVRLLLIKGADRTVKNQDGLTPLDLCLYSGHNMRTYELIKLLKGPPTSKSSQV